MLVADERVSESSPCPRTSRPDDVRGDVLHCLPATMAESTDTANGTMLRPATVRDWAHQAGFPTVDVLPIENPFWRFYRIG